LTNKPQHHPSRSPEDIGDKRYSLTSHHPLGEKLCLLLSCAANISQKTSKDFSLIISSVWEKHLKKIWAYSYTPLGPCLQHSTFHTVNFAFITHQYYSIVKTTTTLRNGDMYNHIDLRYTGYICFKKGYKVLGDSLCFFIKTACY